MAELKRPSGLATEEVVAPTTALLGPQQREPGKNSGNPPETTIFALGSQQLSRDGDSPSVRKPPRFGFRWALELLSLLLGHAAFTIIVVVLALADGSLPPPRPLGLVTLNSFVAFFTTVAKVAFMYPVVQRLGQLKWAWFLSPRARPLTDFQIFDEATRGIFGSVKLLFGYKGLLPWLAAVVTLSGLLTSTITQQAIEYPVMLSKTSNGTASVQRAMSVSGYNGSSVVFAPYDMNRLEQAMFSGLFAAPNEKISHISPLCSSGECEWPLYGSLAVCGDVHNLTTAGNETLLEQLRNKTSARLNTLYDSVSGMLSLEVGVSKPEPFYPLVVGPMPDPTGLFPGSVTPLLYSNQFIAYLDVAISEPPGSDSSIETLSQLKFLEFGLHWCTKTFATQVRQGVASTREVSSYARAAKSVPFSFNYRWTPSFHACITGKACEGFAGIELELEAPPGAPEAGRYFVEAWTALLASALGFVSTYDAAAVSDRKGVMASNGGGIAAALSPPIFGDFHSSVRPTPAEQLDRVRNITRNLAQSLTNLIRTLDERQLLTLNTGTVTGTALTPQTYVSIHWRYITMLGAQLFLVTAFLLATIVRTHQSRLQIIKGSALATLWGLDGETHLTLGSFGDFAILREQAAKIKVSLALGSNGVVSGLQMEQQPRRDLDDG